ncbi:MAG TPA: 1-deoxy-D-xylulose-5-phosphate reductoisomerase, partial [Steroidobacteraceae bacterium]|nr:1-deoxy-D-xylulose-5-phosphate reductoisomerase [Steroidobacteraceae bacterium]
MIGVAVLGSTGSVGESTLDVLARHRARFGLVAIAAHRNVQKLARQILAWQPAYAALADAAAMPQLRALLGAGAPRTRL